MPFLYYFREGYGDICRTITLVIELFPRYNVWHRSVVGLEFDRGIIDVKGYKIDTGDTGQKI